MQVNASVFAQGISCQNQSDRFMARAAQFKEITGRDIIIEKNENGEFVHMLSSESTQRHGFFLEFFRTGFNMGNDCPDGNSVPFMTKLENLARRYSELKNELLEKYGDNEYELYKQLGELNRAFENALQSTVMLPLQRPPSSNLSVSTDPQSVRNQIEREWQEHDNIKGLMQTLKHNMVRHLDNFFKIFIKNIQSSDFDTAFNNSLDALNESESTSMSSLSFHDSILMRDTMFQGHTRSERDDETGEDRDVFIVNRPAHSFRVIAGDDRITELVRREIANLMGFRWRG